MTDEQKYWLDNYLKTHTWRDLFMLQYQKLKQDNMNAVRIISEYAKKVGDFNGKQQLDWLG